MFEFNKRELFAEADKVAAETDLLLQRLEQRRRQPKPDQVVRKDYHGDQPYAPTSWPQSQATMNDIDSRAWNQWFAHSFDDRMDQVVGVIGDETRKLISKQTDDLRAEIIGRLDAIESAIESRFAEIEARILELEQTTNGTRYLG